MSDQTETCCPIPTPALLAQLERHEGFSGAPYLCPAGKCTIGYGTNLEAHPRHIPHEDVRRAVMVGQLRGRPLVRELCARGMFWDRERARDAMLAEARECHEDLFRRCAAYRRLCGADVARAEVLLNMAFNLGVDGLLGFHRTLRCVNAALDGSAAWADVEANLRQSRWWGQVGRRAVELGRQMRTGERAGV